MCQRDGKQACYFGETGCNMHKRMKEHLTKFRSKNMETRESSAFYKHIESEHGGVKQGESFETYFPTVKIVKAYTKVLNRNIEEGTFMINHAGEVLNSKTEWNQPRIIRTTILQGGAEMLGGRVLPAPRAGGSGAAVAGGGAAGTRAGAAGAGAGDAGGRSGAAPGPRTQGGSATGDQMSSRARRYLARTSGS